MNPFILPYDTYKRNLNIKDEYLKQAAFIVSRELSISYSEAVTEVKSLLKDSNISVPNIRHTDRLKNQDTVEKTSGILDYIDNAVNRNIIMTPSWTQYYPPSKKRSSISGYVNKNLALRSVNKGKAKRYELQGDMDKFVFYNTLQKTNKLKNNALSGAFLSHGTLQNPSAHYTLTSVTRMMASIGNMVTESILAGNRGYFDPDDVFNHFATLITGVDEAPIRAIVAKYNLVIPTVDDIVRMVHLSTDRYFRDIVFTMQLRNLVSKFTDEEKCIVMYTQDMYHLRLLNNDAIFNIIDHFSREESGYLDKGDKALDEMTDYQRTLLHYVIAGRIRGMEINLKKLKGSTLYDIYVSTLYNIQSGLELYQDFIRAFFTTTVFPINISRMKDMLRDVIVLSDTDSTCATYDSFVRWFPQSRGRETAITGAVGLFVGETIAHLIYQFATQMGIEKSDRLTLAMKNEFYWSVFMPTTEMKQYIALANIKEGGVYERPQVETKGSNLIGSSLSPFYNKKLSNFIEGMLIKISKHRKISVETYRKFLVNMENELIEKVHSGSPDVFRTDSIKSLNSYKSDQVEKTNYYHHELWNSIFGEKYGYAPDPEYRVFKVNITLSTRKQMMAWAEGIKDPDVRQRALTFFNKYQKNALGMLRLPIDAIKNHGVPDELKPVIDEETLLSNVMTPFYSAASLLGIHAKDKQYFSKDAA